jgi:hypothetical protein
VEEPLLVALIPKRIVLTRYLLSLFAAVLGLCVNCKADSLTVFRQYNGQPYGGCCLEFVTDPGSSSGLQLLDPYHVADGGFSPAAGLGISVPALPAGAVVTSATFSLIALSGTLEAGNGETSIVGTTLIEPLPDTVESLDASGYPSGPCIPPGCAPTIATVAVAYQYAFGAECVLQAPYPAGCFTTPDADLLALGISPATLADGFDVQGLAALYTEGASISSVLYPGFNSETEFGLSITGPPFSESVTVNYTIPEPFTLLLLIPGLLALAAFRQKKATAHSLHCPPGPGLAVEAP